MKWLTSFRSNAHESYGVRGFPLGYVLRENVAVPAAPPLAPDCAYSVEHGLKMNKFTARAGHNHPKYPQDNARIDAKLEEAVRGTTYASSLTPFETRRDGRDAFLALVAQFLGKEKWTALADKQNDYIQQQKWKGNGTFTMERFIGGHRNAYQSLINAQEHIDYQLPNEYTRIGYLLRAIHTTDPGLHAAIANIEGNSDIIGPRYIFEECARLLQMADPVTKKNKRTHAQISYATAVTFRRRTPN